MGKLENLKKKKILFLTLSGMLALGSTGCGFKIGSGESETKQSKYILEDTIFDNAEVLLVDGEPIVAKNLKNDSTDQIKRDNVDSSFIEYHEHYQNISNGNIFADKNCNKKRVYEICSEIEKLGSIENYLTADELKKALSEEGLSDEEVIEIVKRIQEEVKEELKEDEKGLAAS